VAKPKLNQIIAVAAGKKADAHKVKTEVYHLFQKGPLLEGISRSYTPNAEDGDKLPPESKHVQVKVNEGLAKVRTSLTELFDVVATQDFGNTVAKADVVVDGVPVVTGVPVTYLLFLEKQLVDIGTFVEKLPVLDPAKLWDYDSSTDSYATKPIQTVKTKKIPRNHEKADRRRTSTRPRSRSTTRTYWSAAGPRSSTPGRFPPRSGTRFWIGSRSSRTP
jgi:hypothetical protein